MVPRPDRRGIPEIMSCRILVFMVELWFWKPIRALFWVYGWGAVSGSTRLLSGIRFAVLFLAPIELPFSPRPPSTQMALEGRYGLQYPKW